MTLSRLSDYREPARAGELLESPAGFLYAVLEDGSYELVDAATEAELLELRPPRRAA